MKKIMVFINGQKHELESEQTTVGDLIKLGGGNPGEYELQLRKGERGPVEQTYSDPSQTITASNGQHYTTRFVGPVIPA
ncbi:MAG: hypothetical protein QXN55_02165 [Candidatus Nitrosotenuis sp.]